MKFTTKKTILFDLDGTITDSEEGIINSLKYALKSQGITEIEERILHDFIGPPLIDSFKKILGCDETKAREVLEVYREYFRDIGIFENRLYEGVEALLKSLKEDGRILLLATSKPEEFAIRILKHFKIFKYFTVITGSEMDGTRSKKSEVIKHALDKAEIVELSEAVMIGDRMHDMLGAKETGIDSIGVVYGYGSYDELKNAGATLIIETVDDLKNVLMD